MEKFKNKYRIPSARLAGWDYAANGAYFITICTKNRTRFFGKVADGAMQLNEIGQIATTFWQEIKIHAKDVDLGNFVVMPNNVHGIILIQRSARETDSDATWAFGTSGVMVNQYKRAVNHCCAKDKSGICMVRKIL